LKSSLLHDSWPDSSAVAHEALQTVFVISPGPSGTGPLHHYTCGKDPFMVERHHHEHHHPEHHTAHQHGGHAEGAVTQAHHDHPHPGNDTSHDGHEQHDHASDGHGGQHHAGHEAHGGHAGHGDHGDHVGQFRRLFWIMLVLGIPVVAFNPMFAQLLGNGLPEAAWVWWVSPFLGTIIYVWGGEPFLTGAVAELRARQPGMMLLIG